MDLQSKEGERDLSFTRIVKGGGSQGVAHGSKGTTTAKGWSLGTHGREGQGEGLSGFVGVRGERERWRRERESECKRERERMSYLSLLLLLLLLPQAPPMGF